MKAVVLFCISFAWFGTPPAPSRDRSVKPASARNTWLETARENRKKQLRINCSCFFSMVTRTGFEPMLKA